MIVDYKIILILILAIVVLIIYNKIEYVKSDINKLEDKNSKLEDEIFELQKKISLLEKQQINGSCQIKPSTKIQSSKESKPSTQIQSSKETKTSNEKNEMSIIDQINNIHQKEFNTQKNTVEILSNEKDTIEYNATEELELSDTESITSDHSQNIVTYSNEKNDIKNDDVNELIDQLASKNIINDKEIFMAEVIESTNSNESDKNKDNFEKDINIDLEYEKNTSEKNYSESSAKDLMIHRLNDLQNIAKSKNIEITKIVNGKIKNKTKKELCTEIEKNNLNIQKN